MNLLSKDIIDLSPFAAEGTPISASEVQYLNLVVFSTCTHLRHLAEM